MLNICAFRNSSQDTLTQANQAAEGESTRCHTHCPRMGFSRADPQTSQLADSQSLQPSR